MDKIETFAQEELESLKIQEKRKEHDSDEVRGAIGAYNAILDFIKREERLLIH